MCEEMLLKLTARERETVILIAKGLTAREMADRMHIADRTVERHIERCRKKLKATNKVQIVVKALQAGVITLDDIGNEPGP